MERPSGLNVKVEDRLNTLRGIISPSTQIAAQVTNSSTLPVDCLVEFQGHPFEVRDDEEMEALAESIKQQGILYPLLVRKKTDRQYEILAGHRRAMAAKKIGLQSVPVNILDVDDDTAICIMVDTNLKQRELISYSEKARAYKMQMDALKNIKGQGFDSAAKIAEESGDKRRNVFYYIKLNNLIPELLELTDQERLAFRSAAAIADLNETEQTMILELLHNGSVKKISVEQAEILKKQAGTLTESLILNVLLPNMEKDRKETGWEPVKRATQSANKYLKKSLSAIAVDIDEEELEKILIRTVQLYVREKQDNEGSE